MSVRDGEKSGCLLSLDISQRDDNGKYEIPALMEDEIKFKRINPDEHGSAIVMENSRYAINKAIESAKRNIALIFPFASSDFMIHIENLTTGDKAVISDVVSEMIRASDALITFSDEDSVHNDRFNSLHQSFDGDRYYRILQGQIPQDAMPDRKAFDIKKPQ